jgi:hypothetical protein
MVSMSKKLFILAAVASFLMPLTCQARVTRFVVTQRRTFADGKAYGNAGPYERLDGTAYFEVDPKDPLNAVIANLDKAPRNVRGMVEFSSPFIILKPLDMNRGNHKIWYGVNNRGNIIELNEGTFLPVPFTNDPLAAADVGDTLILQLGYTFVDAGWQGNVVRNNKQLVPSFPIAKQPGGSPIIANARVEYGEVDGVAPAYTTPLSNNPGFASYETADTNTAHSTLTIRADEMAPRVPIPSDQWAFGKCPTGPASLKPSTTDLCLYGGFKVDKIYELIYPAKNPIVMGLGYAVTRDIGSFLRYATHDDAGNPNPLALGSSSVGIRRVYGSGGSSTGMYLRDWLYLGFNEDESHRKVFDAVQIVVPGTHRLFANVQFSDPDVYSREDIWHDFGSNSYPPQTFGVTTDPVSGIRDGILKRPATDPLVFQIDTANEFWQMQASLNVADGSGNPVKIPSNVRLYFLSSFSHLGVTSLFRGIREGLPIAFHGNCQYLQHNYYSGSAEGQTTRALIVALDEWADKGVEPPKSNYPRLSDGTLVPLEEAAKAFPKIPAVSFPTVENELQLLDFGPQFNSEGGILTTLPPKLGRSYKVYVPMADKDGLDIAGIRTMETRVPLGTNVGWNLRASGFRAPHLCSLVGSYFPFATTKAERMASGDPRLSLEERYRSHAGFVQAVTDAANQLVQERFLLPEDAQSWINAAEASSVLK